MTIITELSQELINRLKLDECINNGRLIDDKKAYEIKQRLEEVSESTGVEEIRAMFIRMNTQEGINCSEIAVFMLAIQRGDYPSIPQCVIQGISSCVKIMQDHRLRGPSPWLCFLDTEELRRAAHKQIKGYPREAGSVTIDICPDISPRKRKATSEAQDKLVKHKIGAFNPG